MKGTKKGLIGRLKEKLGNQNVTFIHCFLHQESLCAKSVKMSHVMDAVVKATNLIRSRALNHRCFREFLRLVRNDYSDIPYYTEVRWLSRGALLSRFFDLRKEIKEFLEEIKSPLPVLANNEWIQDLAFLSDITGHLNSLNQSLQGKNILITAMYEQIKAFIEKIKLWELQVSVGNCYHFTNLKSLSNLNQDQCNKYSEVLKDLKKEFETRFNDFTLLERMFNVFITPFLIQPTDVPEELQIELIEMQSSTFLKNNFPTMRPQEFYNLLGKHCFPRIRNVAIRIVAMFGSTYTCEQFFSLMKIVKSKHRSRMTQAHLINTLRLMATQSLSPDVDEVIVRKNNCS